MSWFSQVLVGQKAPFHCSLQLHLAKAKLFVLLIFFLGMEGVGESRNGDRCG